jgi:hypothetical protein
MKNLIATALLIFALFGLPNVGPNVVPPHAPDAPRKISINEPSAEMKSAVSKVADALKKASVVDKMLWGQVWAKAGKAVAGDSSDTKVVWNDTTKLRQLNETALRIAWRRIGGNQEGKYPGLREAVESAFASVMTTRNQGVTPELRKKYVELCEAIAWAGIGRDQ